jgi:hypothetical protein
MTVFMKKHPKSYLGVSKDKVRCNGTPKKLLVLALGTYRFYLIY